MGIFRISRKLKSEPLERAKPLLDISPVDVDAAMAVFRPVLDQIDHDSTITYNLESILEENSFEELSLFWNSVKRTRSFYNLLIFGIALLAAGMGIIIIGENMKQADAASITWSITRGTVDESSIGHASGSMGSGGFPNTGGSTGSRGGGSMGIDGRTYPRSGADLFFPVIHYTYVVDGQQYKSDRVFSNNGYANDDLDQQEAIITRYPEGKDIEVFFNPLNPGQSVLFPGDSPGTEVIHTFGIVLALLGGFITLLFTVYTLRRI